MAIGRAGQIQAAAFVRGAHHWPRRQGHHNGQHSRDPAQKALLDRSRTWDWHHHRGRCLICRSDEIDNARRGPTDPERVADDYASDLLLPRYILDPMLRGLPRINVAAARNVADAFDASLTATLIKIVETDIFPMLLVCHSREGRRWFRRSPSVPSRWFPQD